MISALAHIPPTVLKQILECDDWQVTNEDTYNWLLQKDGKDPLVIPKRIKMVPFEIHERCMAVAGIDLARYFELLGKTGYSH